MESEDYCEICGIALEEMVAKGVFIKSVANCVHLGFRICIDCCFVVGGHDLKECDGCKMGDVIKNQKILI